MEQHRQPTVAVKPHDRNRMGRLCDKFRCSRASFSRSSFAHNFTFYRLHFTAFLLMGFAGAIALCLIEESSFIDALFMAFSAVCVTGLVTLDTGRLHLSSQIVIFFLIMGGGNILWSTVPVLMRRYFFAQTMRRQLAGLGIPRHEASRLLDNEVEYRALGWVLRIAYFHLLFWPLLFFVIFGLYFTYNSWAGAVLNGGDGVVVSPWWFSFFHSLSGLNNAGFVLLPDNIIPLADNYFVLLATTFLILAGNTAYPVLMYCSVWALHRLYGPREPAFAFLLARPRKCFTHMFNRYTTVVLAIVIVVSTFSEFFLFLGLDFNETYLQQYPKGVRALIGWFQAISTRTAGFNAIDLSKIAPAMQLVYAFLMVSHKLGSQVASASRATTTVVPFCAPLCASLCSIWSPSCFQSAVFDGLPICLDGAAQQGHGRSAAGPALPSGRGGGTAGAVASGTDAAGGTASKSGSYRRC